jgi:hypothetical protein
MKTKSDLQIVKDLKLLYGHNWIDPKTVIRLFSKEGITKCDALVKKKKLEKRDGKYRIVISSSTRRGKSMGAVS